MVIVVFTQVWNEFFLALSLASRNTQTVQVVMAEAKGTTLLLGRYFIRGILAEALKG